jgi:hypothetical protein
MRASRFTAARSPAREHRRALVGECADPLGVTAGSIPLLQVGFSLELPP